MEIVVDSSLKDATSHFYYQKNGLIGLLTDAWCTHSTCTIKPDDLWNYFMFNLGTFVSKDVETFRPLFSKSSDTKSITIEVNSFGPDESNPEVWNTIFEAFISFIKRNANDPSIFLTKFSTSTQEDIIFNNCLLLSCAKHYYKYKMVTKCGISKVKLLGTIDDYKLIIDNLIKIKNYKLDNSAFNLYLDNTIKAYTDVFLGSFYNDTSEYFKKIIKYNHSRGSGSRITITGWFLDLIPFESSGNRSIDPIDYDSIGFLELSKVPIFEASFPVKWNYLGNRINFKIDCYYNYESNNLKLKPIVKINKL